jgi:hypothetical protein
LLFWEFGEVLSFGEFGEVWLFWFELLLCERSFSVLGPYLCLDSQGTAIQVSNTLVICAIFYLWNVHHALCHLILPRTRLFTRPHTQLFTRPCT